MKRALILLTVLLSTSQAFAQSGMNSTGSKYNFRFSPLSLLIGVANVSLDVTIAPDWTLGPSLSYAKFKIDANGNNGTSYDVNLASAGVRANWFRNGVYTDGLYVAPFVTYLKTSIEASGTTTVTGDAAGVAFGGIVGYGWFWNSFNMMLGAGAAAATGESNMVVTDNNGNRTDVPNRGVGLTGEYTIGWTF